MHVAGPSTLCIVLNECVYTPVAERLAVVLHCGVALQVH